MLHSREAAPLRLRENEPRYVVIILLDRPVEVARELLVCGVRAAEHRLPVAFDVVEPSIHPRRPLIVLSAVVLEEGLGLCHLQRAFMLYLLLHLIAEELRELCWSFM